MIETDNTETDTDSIIHLPLMDVIHHYRDDITYAKSILCHTTQKQERVILTQIHSIGTQMKYLTNLTDSSIHMIYEMLFSHVVGKRYCLETPKIKLLTGRFNAARENKIVTILNEAANVKQSSHEDQDELKDCITEPTCMIEQKGIDPYRVKDCNNIAIASNNSYSVKASNQMRRFIYLLCKNQHIGDKAYFEMIRDEFNKADGGIHLYHYLMSIDLDGFHPQDDALMTKEKSDMQKSAIEKPLQWLIECVINGTSNSIFSNSQIETTPSTLEFVSIDTMLSQFTKWMIEESRDTSSYSRDRFSKTLTKVLGPNCKKQVLKIRHYELSVNGLKETIT